MPDPSEPLSREVLDAIQGGRLPPPPPPRPAPTAPPPSPEPDFPRFDFSAADPDLSRRFVTPIGDLTSQRQEERGGGLPFGLRIPQFDPFVSGLAGSVQGAIENIGSLIAPGDRDFRLPGTQGRLDDIVEQMGFDPDQLRANPDTLSGTFQTPSGLTFTKRTGEEILEIAERELRRQEAPEGPAEIAGSVLGGFATLGAAEEGRSVDELSRATGLESIADTLIGGTVPAIGAGVAPLAGALARRATGAVASRIPQSQRAQIAQVARRDIPEFAATERPVGARSSPSEIPNGPRITDPSGAPSATRPPLPVPRGKAAPEEILADIQRVATIGEQRSQTLLRRHGGALREAEDQAKLVVLQGNRELRALDIGQMVRGRLAPRPSDIPELTELNRALHNPSKIASGELTISDRLRPHFERLRQLTDWEEASRIDFDPTIATIDDYFYRGWKVPKGFPGPGLGLGALGRKPGFKFPRQNATFDEMLDAGFEPLFQNPYEQWRVSRLMGVRYRQQIQLIDDFKRAEIAVPDAGGAGIKGWRTPKVGPAFEGKPFADAETGQTGFTRRWLVPNEIANRLESMYGVPVNLGTVRVGGRNIDLLKAADVVTFLPKRAKLFGSIFQQRDFLQRNLTGTWATMVDELRAGRPVGAVKSLARWPKSAYEMVQANLGPGARERLLQEWNSTTPLVQGRPGVNPRGIVEAGLSRFDATLLPQNLDEIPRLAAQDAGLLGVKKVMRLVGDLESMMRRGLFEGWYPAAQLTDIRNNIAPTFAKKFPNLSDEALNGMIARFTNIKYSTITPEQSVVQNRAIRETLIRVFFSLGEAEGLLRQGTQAIKGPNADLWRRQWVAAYVGLIGTANLIHFASTGENLPFDRYVPISRDNFGPLPFSYNRDFAAPNIPLTGRTGSEVLLDLVGQMDTVFRVLDPVAFIKSRESVPIRAFENQRTAKNFFQQPIDEVGPGGIFSRTAQLADDLFSPIGPGELGRLGAERIPGAEGLIPTGEARLGTQGRLFQATGINVRAEVTGKLLDRAAQEQFGQTYDSLGPNEREAVQNSPDIQAELRLRRETAVERGDVISIYFAGRDKRIEEFDQSVDAVAEQLGPGKAFRSRLGDLQLIRGTRLDEVEQFNPEAIELLGEREPREHRLDRALRAYFDALEEAKLEDPVTGDFDFARQRTVLASLREQWGDDVIDEVETFVRRNDHPLVAQLKDSREILRPYWGMREVMAELLNVASMFQEWSNLPAEARQQFLDLPQNRRLKEAFRQADQLKVRLRQTDPEIDRHLLAWGYVTTPQHPELKAEMEILKRIQGGVVEDRSSLLPQPVQREPEAVAR